MDNRECPGLDPVIEPVSTGWCPMAFMPLCRQHSHDVKHRIEPIAPRGNREPLPGLFCLFSHSGTPASRERLGNELSMPFPVLGVCVCPQELRKAFSSTFKQEAR